MALRVLETQDVIQIPVEVVCDVRYLLVERGRGVACYPPASTSSPLPSSLISLIF